MDNSNQSGSSRQGSANNSDEFEVINSSPVMDDGSTSYFSVDEGCTTVTTSPGALARAMEDTDSSLNASLTDDVLLVDAQVPTPTALTPTPTQDETVRAGDNSPAKNDTSSAKSDTSPTKNDTSLAKNDTSPAKGDTGPTKNDTSPAAKGDAAKGDTSPTKNDTRSAKNDTTPAKNDTSPAKNGTSPAKGDTAKGDTSSTQNENSPAKGDTAKGDTSPTKNDTSSAKNDTSPSKNDTSPTKNDPRSPKDDISSDRSDYISSPVRSFFGIPVNDDPARSSAMAAAVEARSADVTDVLKDVPPSEVENVLMQAFGVDNRDIDTPSPTEEDMVPCCAANACLRPDPKKCFGPSREMSMTSTPRGVATVRVKMRADSPAVFNEPLSTSTEESQKTPEENSPTDGASPQPEEPQQQLPQQPQQQQQQQPASLYESDAERKYMREAEEKYLRRRAHADLVAGEDGEAEPLIQSCPSDHGRVYDWRRGTRGDMDEAVPTCWCFGCIQLFLQWIFQRLGLTRYSRQD